MDLTNILSKYDKAMQSKLTDIFPNTIGTFPETAMFDSNSEGKVSLPLISFYRTSNNIDFNDYNDSETRKGYSHRASEDGTSTAVIPISLIYQIDLWGSTRDEADNLFTDLIYILMIRPNITLDLDQKEVNKVFSLRLLDQSYSSNLQSLSVSQNRIYRYTLTYQVNEAKLIYHRKYQPVIKIPVGLSYSHKQNKDGEN